MRQLPETLYTSDQVRDMDRVAIHDKGIPGIALMRRAGGAVFEQIRLRWPTINELRVYCGGGNNAGDGYVIARLALAADYRVSVIALSDPEDLRGDALTAFQDYIRAGGQVISYSAQVPPAQAVVVDALFGTGLSRRVSEDFASAIAAINASDCPVIAVDIPSGLSADTGQVMGCAVKADCTVSFIALKQGLFTGEAAEYCGDIHYADLQVPGAIFDAYQASARLLQPSRLPRRHRCAHKGHFGHVLLIGGDVGYYGAIRLAAEASLRSGAGLVSVATREIHSHVINSGRPEIMSHGVERVEQLQPLLQKADVVVIGPGLGQSAWAKALFAEAMASDKRCVADADALNLLSKDRQAKSNRIITPHPGEAARLLGCTTAEIAADRYAAVTQLQDRYGGVAVLKGAGSLIKDQEAVFVSTSGNPGMATGGMGDVLSGMLGALLAQGLTLSESARIGVYSHGAAADRAAQDGGERGLLASDLFPYIRKLFNE